MIDPLEASALRGLAKIWRRRAERQDDDDIGTGLKMATEKCCEELELVLSQIEEVASIETVGDGVHWPGTT